MGPDYIEHLGRSFETQTHVYEQAVRLRRVREADWQSGWIMWTWKTEEAADWSMQSGITYGTP